MEQNKYVELISHAKGEAEDLDFELFELICKENNVDEQIAAFAFVCEATLTLQSDESREIPPHFSKERLLELRNVQGPFVDATLEYVTQKAYREHLSSNEFYELLWNLVFVPDTLKEFDEKAFALYWILADRLIPFVSLPEPILIESDEIKSFIENNLLLAHRIKYITGLTIGKRTIVASMLVQELESLQTETEKTIMLTYLLAEIDKNSRKADRS